VVQDKYLESDFDKEIKKINEAIEKINDFI